MGDCTSAQLDVILPDWFYVTDLKCNFIFVDKATEDCIFYEILSCDVIQMTLSHNIYG